MSTMDSQHEEHADGIVEDREQAPPVYFTVLFFGLIIWGVAFMAFYLLSGWSSDAEFTEKMAAHKGEPVVAQETAPAPAPKPAPAKPPKPEPAASAPTAAAAPAAAVTESIDIKVLFAKQCGGCHGPEGKGAFGPDLSAEYQYGKNFMAARESIASGRPGNMPGFDQKLSAAEIDALTNFILSL